MCGFAGFTGYLENGKDVLTDMMNKIIHRGPDSAGQYIDDKAYMGFRRLSIIDLDNGSQPMFNENKKIVITFNGEIYNYQDLRKDLIEKGHIFANNSDTEVLIHAYEEYGEDMLNKLRGMFAFVICRVCQYALNLRTIYNVAVNYSVVERLNSKEIPCTKESFLLTVPYNKCKHTTKLI